jgi:hypothetical protein
MATYFGGALRLEQEKGSDQERDQPAEPEHADAGRKRLAQHHRDAEQQEGKRPILHRQDGERDQGEQQRDAAEPLGKSAPGLQNSNKSP